MGEKWVRIGQKDVEVKQPDPNTRGTSRCCNPIRTLDSIAHGNPARMGDNGDGGMTGKEGGGYGRGVNAMSP